MGSTDNISPIETLRNKVRRYYPNLKTDDIKPCPNEGEYFSIFLEDGGVIEIGWEIKGGVFRIDWEDEHYGNEIPNQEKTWALLRELIEHR